MDMNHIPITLDRDRVERIAIETIRVLKSRFEKIPSDQDIPRNMPFHMAFLRAFYGKIDINNEDEALKFLTLSSWFHGLSTTLGQSYFENIAHILSDGEKKSFSGYTIKESVKIAISDIITDLKSGKEKPNPVREINILRDALEKEGPESEGLNFTADVYIEDRDSVIMIELKSVRPNSGEMRGEKQKILYGLAHLMQLKKNKTVKFYLGFPFDPTEDRHNPCGYNKERFSKSLVEFTKFFSHDEFLIASELWDFLSGQPKTMCQLLKIINSIARPDFEEKFEIINTFSFIHEDGLYTEKAINKKLFDRYISILQEWHLYSEIELAKTVFDIATGDISLNRTKKRQFERLIHTSMFRGAQYNHQRKEKIFELVGG